MRYLLIIAVLIPSLCFAGQGMGPGPGLSRVTATNEPDTGFETGTLEGYTGPNAAILTDSKHSGTYAYFAYEDLPDGTYGTVLSKTVTLNSGNGSVWVYITSAGTQKGVRIKFGGSQVGSATVEADVWTEIPFTIASSGSGTFAIESQSSYWDDGIDSGYDTGLTIDDINYP